MEMQARNCNQRKTRFEIFLTVLSLERQLPASREPAQLRARFREPGPVSALLRSASSSSLRRLRSAILACIKPFDTLPTTAVTGDSSMHCDLPAKRRVSSTAAGDKMF